VVCPVDIPLPRQILEVRRRAVAAQGLPASRRLILYIWGRPRLFRAVASLAAIVVRPFARDGLADVPLPARHRWRTPPAPTMSPALARLPVRIAPVAAGPLANSAARGKTVAYFVQCLTDRLAPEQAESATRVLAACGVRVVVPRGQHCCGLPMIDSGATDGARRLAKQTISLLEETGADYVISAANSCVAAITHDYPHLLRDEPDWQARSKRLAERVLDLATFLDRIAGLAPGQLAIGKTEERFTYHPFCQTRNVLHADASARRLLQEVCGLELLPLPEAEVCCGFGGSTSFEAPEVSQGIVDRKLANVDLTQATVLISDNPGCLMHLRGAAHASGRRSLRVRHLAEVLADHLDRAGGTGRAG
jgi:Fe-S oxidoreductase